MILINRDSSTINSLARFSNHDTKEFDTRIRIHSIRKISTNTMYIKMKQKYIYGIVLKISHRIYVRKVRQLMRSTLKNSKEIWNCLWPKWYNIFFLNSISYRCSILEINEINDRCRIVLRFSSVPLLKKFKIFG